MRVDPHPDCRCSCHTDMPYGSYMCDRYGCELCIEAWAKEKNKGAPPEETFLDNFGKLK